MSGPATTQPQLDEATLAFAQRVFGFARAGDHAALTELLTAGLPANLTNDKGDTLLMLACYHGHHATAGLLLDHGADPERANENGAGRSGRTALMTAAMFDRGDIAEVLLARGARLDARDADGLTAASAARLMGAETMADWLEHRAAIAVSQA
jgi:uncharacterized protein